jgi:selenocysteine lyase
VKVSHKTGRVEVEDIVNAIQEETCLITVMMANNETGVIQVRINAVTSLN